MLTEQTLQSDTLQDQLQPIEPTDTLAEAGRKMMLANFIEMKKHEAGSLTGEDIEDVHQMRVATRRMRSIFRLLKAHYKSKTIQPFMAQLKVIASHLGAVRDLDVMIDNLEKHQKNVDASQKSAVAAIIQQLDKKRSKARKRLQELVDSKSYKRFIKDFQKFLTQPGKGAANMNKDFSPHEVRHVAPIILHEHLAAVRAYDNFIEDAPAETMHQLRIEFKRLRYAVNFFKDVLGKSIDGFITELKTMQDYLGRLNDIVVASDQLNSLKKLDEAQEQFIENYLAALEAEASEKMSQYPELWQHFNGRTVQRKLADALLVLR